MKTLCRLAELTDAKPHVFDVDGEDILVVRLGGEVYAVSDRCSHAEVPLSQGEVVERSIECWLHGSRFDLATGEPSGPPACEPIPTYATTIDPDGTVAVDTKRSRENR